MNDYGPGPRPGAVGEAADGRVRVVLDPGGRVTEVELADDVTEMPVRQLSAALTAAFQRAQAAAGAEFAGLPPAERLAAASERAMADAERRFNEISTVLYDLDRRAGRDR